MENVHKMAEEITRRLVEDTVRSQYRRANLATIAELANQDLNEDRMVDDALGVAFGLDPGIFYDKESEHDRFEVMFVAERLQELLARCPADQQLVAALYTHGIYTPAELEQALAAAREPSGIPQK